MSGGTIVLDGVALALQHATLETYHGDTDWNLFAEGVDGAQVQISGTADRALAVGTALLVHHVDQPTPVVAAGEDGMLVTTPDEAACSITVAAIDEPRVRLEAQLVLEWVSLSFDGAPSRPFPVHVSIDAELTRET